MTQKKVAAVLCKTVYEKDRSLRTLKNVQPEKQISAVPEESRLNFDIGTESKINADFIVGTIVEATGLPISAIGKIYIYRDHTVVEMAEANANLVLKKMNGYRIKQRTIHITELKGKKPGSFQQGGGKAHTAGSRRYTGGKSHSRAGASYNKYHTGRSK